MRKTKFTTTEEIIRKAQEKKSGSLRGAKKTTPAQKAARRKLANRAMDTMRDACKKDAFDYSSSGSYYPGYFIEWCDYIKRKK